MISYDSDRSVRKGENCVNDKRIATFFPTIYSKHGQIESNEDLKKESAKIRKVLKVGKKALKTGDNDAIKKFIELWNDAVKQKIIPTNEMKNLFMEIQNKYKKSLYIIKIKQEGVFLRDYGELPRIIEKYWFNQPAISHKYREWLIYKEIWDGYSLE